MREEYFFVRQDLCKVDLKKVALPSDIEFMNRFLRNDKVFHAIEEVNFEREYPELDYREVVKNYLPLITLPEKLDSALRACRDALGFTEEVRFCVSGTGYNASVVRCDGQPTIIMLGAGVLDDFNGAEIAFVIGHELAHVLYSHSVYPMHMQLQSQQVGDLISIKDKLSSNMWPRKSQVTADRIGLICCRDFDAAVSALYRVYVGAASANLPCDTASLLAEYERFASTVREWVTVNDAYREIYPLARIKCLEIFSESAYYCEVVGGKSTRADDDATAASEAVIALMEPAYLRDDGARQKTKERFILTAGFFMMTADGKITDDEVSTLKTLVSREVFDAHYPDCVKFPRHELWQGRLYNRGQELEWFASVAEKHEIARNLVTLAYADGDLNEREKNALYEICGSLQLSPYTTDELLSEKSVLS